MGKKDKVAKVAQSPKTKEATNKAAPVPVKASKSKKAALPPPESSSSSESDSSDSDSEAVPSKPVANGKANPLKQTTEKPKANGVKAGATKTAETSSSESESSDSEPDSDKAITTAPKKAAAKDDTDSDSDSDSDTDSKPNHAVSKAAPKAPPAGGAKSDDDSSDESSDDDGDTAMKDGTAAHTATASKRKADVDTAAPAKKAKINEETSTNPASSTIWIGNLSWNVDDDWLKTEFETYGELISARVQMDRNTGRSRGFAYVEFREQTAAQAAVNDTTKEIDGRAPRIDFAPPRSAPDQAKRARAFDDKVSEPSSILFVGNLSFDATEDGCWEAFGDFGEVLSVRLPTDRETQQPKGFGYVEFGDQASAIKAFEALKGKELFGRPIRLDYSHPRDPSGGSRGGRGGDRGRGGFRGGDRGGRGGQRGGFRGGRGNDRGRGAPRGRGAGAQAFAGKKITF